VGTVHGQTQLPRLAPEFDGTLVTAAVWGPGCAREHEGDAGPGPSSGPLPVRPAPGGDSVALLWAADGSVRGLAVRSESAGRDSGRGTGGGGLGGGAEPSRHEVGLSVTSVTRAVAADVATSRHCHVPCALERAEA
jgi:hypothetical protein